MFCCCGGGALNWKCIHVNGRHSFQAYIPVSGEGTLYCGHLFYSWEFLGENEVYVVPLIEQLWLDVTHFTIEQTMSEGIFWTMLQNEWSWEQQEKSLGAEEDEFEEERVFGRRRELCWEIAPEIWVIFSLSVLEVTSRLQHRMRISPDRTRQPCWSENARVWSQGTKRTKIVRAEFQKGWFSATWIGIALVFGERTFFTHVD